jgi:FkbH-like protein
MGVLVAIASKNDEAPALAAIDGHPDMVLRRDAFAAWRINWDDKAANIAAIAGELSLGLGDVVFIDDSAAERDRVRSALPMVAVPDWPADPLLYAHTLRASRLFDTAAISDEDRARGGQVHAERSRQGMLDQLGSVEAWVRSLEVRLHVAPLDQTSLARAAQLYNKTNQMNLTTRRMTAAELVGWAHAPGHTVLTVRAADRLGDYGLVGVLGLAAGVDGDGDCDLVDFVLSCRAMGRGVEEAMLRVAVGAARRASRTRLVARYVKTERNAACLKKLSSLAPAADRDAATFTWDTAADPPAYGDVLVVDGP